ncbi:MAG: hypothetical protein ACP5U2_14945 [Bryobacteraceae bacterium]
MLGLLWQLSRGYRLCPWRSPYLRWRIETYWGIPADSLGFREFWRFLWRRRADLLRYLRWAARMRCLARHSA